ncbi:N-acetyltransferase family protein [Glutamicibacter sp. 2E12]|uniref:GNAT family N-acetyltransferase n=1 Tax=Glutamicibacter sp. 2E12 TaxID=3416181 RepID=UPI003CEA2A7A
MLTWYDAEFKHHADLQKFTCAPFTLQKAKKEQKRTGSIDAAGIKVWASFVQGCIRNLRPPASDSDTILLGRTKGDGDLAAIYHATDLSWENQTLLAALNLIGVGSKHQGRRLGQHTLERFFEDLGNRARNLGCTRIEITATVHDSNAESHGLIKRNGWVKLHPAPRLRDCTVWGISGQLDPERPLPKSELPLPLVEADEADLIAHIFPDGGPTPETPLGTALLWQSAILNLENDEEAEREIALSNFQYLAFDPDVWGEISELPQLLKGWALMSNIIDSETHPGVVAYAKMIPDTGKNMKAFSDAPLYNFLVITLLFDNEQGYWKVWSTSENWAPTASRVLGLEE